MHAYVADRDASRIRLLYSASHFRGTEDTEERNLVGRANRFLHWSEIQSAQEAGFELYDLGGLPINHNDPAKNAIARFKSEFGGTPILEYNGYTSRNPIVRYAIPTLQRLFA
jgi:lipid II:glycine glycyltransferase (peptidoglycan interpeptide bridge formation enzyme)